MAALNEVPFRLYYGSVDATPLFVMLVCLYVERTGDEVTLRSLWPHVEAALAWIDEPRRIRTRMALSSITERPNKASQIRAGRTRMMRFSIPMDASPRKGR